jgi:hypothetical protein
LMILYLIHSTPKCITKYGLWEASKPSTTSHSTSCKWPSYMWTSFICFPCSSLLICLMPNLINTHIESLGESSVCKKTTKKMGIWLLPIYVISLGRHSSRQKYKIQEISLTWSYMARFLSSFKTCKKEFIN